MQWAMIAYKADEPVHAYGHDHDHDFVMADPGVIPGQRVIGQMRVPAFLFEG
jgi:hypothetical protein